MFKKKRSPQRIERDNAKYEEWRKRNPSKEFKDYFAETVKAELLKGRGHPTLGAKLIDDEYGASGRGFLKRLLDCGLKPDDVCVDYGCGTLRIGVHVIDYLDPGLYWGLDIADFLLEQGRGLIGEARWTEKQPRLRVISPDAVSEVAASKPTMLFSANVLIHVHPQELDEYIGNVMTIVGSHGQALIDGKWTDDETIQSSGRSWAHALSTIRELVRGAGGDVVILNENEFELEGLGRTAKRGVFRISS